MRLVSAKTLGRSEDEVMMKGYKGFDKDLKCMEFQYEVGGEYEEPEAKICEKGFHFLTPFFLSGASPLPPALSLERTESRGETY